MKTTCPSTIFIPLLNLLSFHSLLALQTSTVVPKQTPCLPLATFRLKSLSFPDHQIPITDFIWNNLLWIQCRPTLTFLPTSASLNYEESTWTHLLIQPRKSAKFFFLFFALMQILSKPLTLHFPFRPRLWQLICYAVILKIVLLNNSVCHVPLRSAKGWAGAGTETEVLWQKRNVDRCLADRDATQLAVFESTGGQVWLSSPELVGC